MGKACTLIKEWGLKAWSYVIEKISKKPNKKTNKLKQTNADRSPSGQAGRDLNLNYNLQDNNKGSINNSNSDYNTMLKDCTISIFIQNLPNIQQTALSTAKDRGIELFTDFGKQLPPLSSEIIAKLSEPESQFAILKAANGYAKSGSEIHKALLVDLLVKHTAQREPNIMQVTLFETLDVVPKLTAKNLDILTL